MKLSIFIFILLLFLAHTFSVKRKLHIFEVLVIWMTVWLVTHSVSSILITNLGAFSVPRNLEDFWFHLLKRLFLYPLIIVNFIELSLRTTSKLIKAFLLVVNILVLPIPIFLFMKIGVLINNHYSWKTSLVEWAITIAITYSTWFWYRKIYLRRMP